MKILIFALGQKGFSVVKALTESSLLQSIFCVVGQDKGVKNDYSSALVSFCNQHNIGYFLHDTISFSKDDYDLFLAVGWRCIIRNIPEEKLIIFHDSLLPKYRGFAPLVNALINKEKTTGVTVLRGASEYDRGNILLQKSLDIVYPTNIEREIQRISDVYAELAVELLQKLIDKTVDPSGYPQDEKQATYSLWRNEDDYRINWSESANAIEHFVSCVNYPYQGASAILNGSVVRILKVRQRADIKIENRTPGKIVFLESDLPVVVCGTGLLVLIDVRNENGDSLLPLKNFRSRFY